MEANMKFKSLMLILLTIMGTSLQAQTAGQEDPNLLDELDPHDPNIEETLKEMDELYELETGMSSHLEAFGFKSTSCYQRSCAVFIDVNKKSQRAQLFINGEFKHEWKVSTGTGTRTPDMDTKPNGRIYDTYTSTKFPGGNYKGLGNMPYAVFIKGGFAIHGTTVGNFPKLGTKASHGCIRLHPDNAKVFNRAVRKYGVSNSWITVR